MGKFKGGESKGVEGALKGCLEEDVAIHVSALPYKRSEKHLDYRNGYYERDLETELGLIEVIRIHRARGGCFETQVFKRYHRMGKGVNRNIWDIFLAGVSRYQG